MMWWKKVEIEGSKFLLKHNVDKSTNKIFLTDFVNLWFEEIKEDSLVKRCKEMNKLIEADDKVLLGHIFSSINSVKDDIIRSFTDIETSKVLNLQTNLEGFKFKIKFILKSADHLRFFEEVTCPLLTVISELDKRQELLVDVIKKKDVEILEYKLEGGQISRKAVETAPFDLEAFSVKCCEGLSATKTSVSSCPPHSLTPFVKDLMVKISTAPVLKENKESQNNDQNNRKKVSVKLKSPIKHKKAKIYDDDMDGSEKEKEEEIKIKQEPEMETKKLKTKAKVQQLLPNL